jgi:AcrR family transcriptional regulator
VADAAVVRVPPHRPSRRLEIVEAAIRVFAECPLSETTVEQMAAECGVAVTAVYYHFSSKEELFDEAFKTCLRSVSQTIDDERSRAGTMDSDVLREVIYASWAWFRTHPVEARFFTLHSGGATPESRRAFDEWQEFHARRAFDYLPEDERPSITSRKGREMYAARLLGFHFLNRLLNGAQTAWLDGPLAKLPVSKLEDALADVLLPVMVGPIDISGKGSH